MIVQLLPPQIHERPMISVWTHVNVWWKALQEHHVSMIQKHLVFSLGAMIIPLPTPVHLDLRAVIRRLGQVYKELWLFHFCYQSFKRCVYLSGCNFSIITNFFDLHEKIVEKIKEGKVVWRFGNNLLGCVSCRVSECGSTNIFQC